MSDETLIASLAIVLGRSRFDTAVSNEDLAREALAQMAHATPRKKTKPTEEKPNV